MIPPFVLDPVPIVPKIDLYPSDLIIDHLILGQENKQNPKMGKSLGFFQKSFITRLQ